MQVYFSNYRYGFNGMEKDDEVSGEGNSYTTEFRHYDPRLGRWKSLDPLMLMFPNVSPYVAFDNNPIFFTDPYGLAPGGPPEDNGTAKGGDTKDGYVYKCDDNNSKGDGWISLARPEGAEAFLDYRLIYSSYQVSPNSGITNVAEIDYSGVDHVYPTYGKEDYDIFPNLSELQEKGVDYLIMYNFEGQKYKIIDIDLTLSEANKDRIEAANKAYEERVNYLVSTAFNFMDAVTLAQLGTVLGKSSYGKMGNYADDLTYIQARNPSLTLNTTTVGYLDDVVRLETMYLSPMQRAPAGGTYFGTKFYKGGQLMPMTNKTMVSTGKYVGGSPPGLAPFSTSLKPSPNYSGLNPWAVGGTGLGLGGLGYMYYSNKK